MRTGVTSVSVRFVLMNYSCAWINIRRVDWFELITAGNFNQKGNYTDKRKPVYYDDDDPFSSWKKYSSCDIIWKRKRASLCWMKFNFLMRTFMYSSASWDTWCRELNQEFYLLIIMEYSINCSTSFERFKFFDSPYSVCGSSIYNIWVRGACFEGTLDNSLVTSSNKI